MAAICCHHALAAVGRSVPQTTLGARRHAGASFPFSTTPINYPRRLVSRAAINIPPDALVHLKKIKDDQGQWGIDRGDKDEVLKLWFLITGVDVSNVQKEVEVNLPDGSNVLTIKKKKEKMKAPAHADELLDVRLLLTEDYDRKGIEVKGTNEEGKVRLEVTITQKATTPFHKIDIN
ncbi:uncharacterized protein LOC120644496 [Panicum virgatum]|uniref:Uncharacterized protein n=1 Tax=Panicum virgatum TaxID=38727 RepID=A0A8T0PNU7_PANVG|nr:uncharacterized protein LOC120644496 [Panicum virgatum]KAG2562259.1 hypothetical protein PVAP13_8KG212200 [Panicum virgatum]